jgi:hypothetical protein
LQGGGQVKLGGCDLLSGAEFAAWVESLDDRGVLLFEEGLGLSNKSTSRFAKES